MSLLATIDGRTASQLAEADPEFAQAFDEYQREFSCRALNYELAEPSLAETPEVTLRLLADQIARKYDPDTEAAALAERRKAAKKRPEPPLPDGHRQTASGSNDLTTYFPTPWKQHGAACQ